MKIKNIEEAISETKKFIKNKELKKAKEKNIEDKIAEIIDEVNKDNKDNEQIICNTYPTLFGLVADEKITLEDANNIIKEFKALKNKIDVYEFIKRYNK